MCTYIPQYVIIIIVLPRHALYVSTVTRVYNVEQLLSFTQTQYVLCHYSRQALAPGLLLVCTYDTIKFRRNTKETAVA